MCLWVFFVSGNMGSLPRGATVPETCHFPDQAFGFHSGSFMFGVSAMSETWIPKSSGATVMWL